MSASWKRRAVAFLASQCVTLFGSSVVQFAIVWYVTLTTSSGTLVSALTICSFVPQMLVSFFSGVWADRYSRKLLIIVSDAGIAAATLALALMLPLLEQNGALLPALLVVSALRSVGTGIQTPAVNAVIPQIVPKEHLMRFNGVNAAVQSAVQFAAPAAAGALLTCATLGGALWIDIATAVAGISVLACLTVARPSRADAEAPAPVLAELRSGVRYARKNGFLARLLMAYGAFILLCVPAGFQATLFASREFGDNYAYLAIVELVGFAGMAGGGALLGAWGGFRSHRATLCAGLASFGALGAGMGLSRGFVPYLALMAVLGVALTMVQTSVTTLLQENTEENMQGRMFGFLSIMYSGCLPIGMAVFGPLADVVSMRVLMVVSCALLIALAGALRLDKRFYAE